MTDVDNLPAGRDLDARIATQVMGYTSGVADVQVWNYPDGQRDLGDVVGSLPHYSTDIAAAWEVVEKLCQEHYWFDLSWNGQEADVTMDHRHDGTWRQIVRNLTAPTAPLAICRAALKAVGASK